MQLLEEYEELIDRDAAEISYLWKFGHIFLYLSSAISGYVCSVLFYITWEHVFDGNCPLWAKSDSILTPELDSDDIPNRFFEISSNCTNWWKHVVIDYNYGHKCDIYLITCFLSCIFGVMWFALFLMCGRGGYGEHESTIYEAPWRIVSPAIVFTSTFLLITKYTTSDLEEGYNDFIRDLRNVFLQICSKYEMNDISNCEVIKSYTDPYNFHEHDACNIIFWLQVFSSIMLWSWLVSFIILTVRVVLIVDFRILKVTIYKPPEIHAADDINTDKTEESNNKQKKKTS